MLSRHLQLEGGYQLVRGKNDGFTSISTDHGNRRRMGVLGVAMTTMKRHQKYPKSSYDFLEFLHQFIRNIHILTLTGIIMEIH